MEKPKNPFEPLNKLTWSEILLLIPAHVLIPATIREIEKLDGARVTVAALYDGISMLLIAGEVENITENPAIVRAALILLLASLRILATEVVTGTEG